MTTPDTMTAEMPVESQSPLAAAGEAFHNFAGRISNGLRSGYEAIREVPGNIKTYAAIGASAVTLFTLANAESAVANPDPFAGENTPTLLGDTAPQATTGSLEQQCATDILKQPKVYSSTGAPSTALYNAGTKRQEFDVGMNFGAVDPDCKGHFKRLPYFMPQLVRDGHKINESDSWRQLFTPGYDPNLPGNFGYSYHTSLTAPKYEYWQPGDKAQFRLRIADLNLATKKVVATSVTTHHMSIVSHK